MYRLLSPWVVLLLVAVPGLAGEQAASLDLADGDRVVLLGNSFWELEDRYGYLETALTRRFPDRNVTFRTLAWSGDTVALESWTYSRSHTDDELRPERLFHWVERMKPTVLLLNFGAVEMVDPKPVDVASWGKAYAGLLDRLDQAGAKDARKVLLAPVPLAGEGDHPTRTNARRAEMVQTLRQLANDRKLVFLDPWASFVGPVGAGFGTTVNDMHLTPFGYYRAAQALEAALGWSPINRELVIDLSSGQATETAAVGSSVTELAWKAEERVLSFQARHDTLPLPTSPALAELPAATLAKLAVERGGFGGQNERRAIRIAGLPPGSYALYVDGKANVDASADAWAKGVALQSGGEFDRAEELRAAILEKDRLFFNWWRPQNETYITGFRRGEQGRNVIEFPMFEPLVRKAEQTIARLRQPDTHAYHLLPLPTLETGRIRGPESLPSTDPADELASFRTAEGWEVTLFASEPMIANPINMAWDPQGRLWVACSPIYPHIVPGGEPTDTLIILEDTDQDGRADKRTVFADNLMVPEGILPDPDGKGAYVANSTELIHLRDTNDDGKADQTRVILTGFGTEDTHHILHSFAWGPDARLYAYQSVLVFSHVETPFGVRRLGRSGLWQFDPPSQRLEIAAGGMINPWGLHFDKWGQMMATDGAGSDGMHWLYPGANYRWARNLPRHLDGMNPGHPKYAGLVQLTGRGIPQSWQERWITADFRAHRLASFQLEEQGSGYISQPAADLLTSSHGSFRPVDLKMGPDGALYICDWYNPIINHGEVDFRDKRRDHDHGRIFRMRATNADPLEPPSFNDQTSVDTMLAALLSPEQYTRDQARRVLETRQPIGEIIAWLTQNRENPLARLQAYWLLESYRRSGAIADNPIFEQALSDPDHHVRAYAARTLADHAGRPDFRNRLTAALADAHPQVRLEAVRVVSRIADADAVTRALAVLDQPMDKYLDYALWTTVRELSDTWLPAYLDGRLSFGDKTHHALFALQAVRDPRALTPLVAQLAAGKIPAAHRASVLDMVREFGTAEHLRSVFDLALSTPEAADRRMFLDALLRAAAERRAVPAGDLVPVLELSRRDGHAYRLAGYWRVPGAVAALRAFAEAGAANEQAAAFDALGGHGGPQAAEALRAFTATDKPAATRAAALTHLVRVDSPGAARLTAALLAELSAPDAPTVSPAMVGELFDAIIRDQQGPNLLANALVDKPVATAYASLGMQKAGSAGRRGERLAAQLLASSGLQPMKKTLTGDEMAELLAEVAARGDAHRGEVIYRRTELGCVKCHALGGAGGKVGPDLSSLGASAPHDYIVESLLEPSKKLKEGYDTLLVLLDDGSVLTGRRIRESDNELVILDANAKEVTIPRDSIEQQSPSAQSLMPDNLTATLKRGEFVDLVKFMTAVGKAEGFKVEPTRRLVRSWLTMDPAPGNGWRVVASRIDGSVPAAELGATVRFQVDASAAGEVDLVVNGATFAEVLVDGAAVTPPATAGRYRLTLAAGSHTVTLAGRSGDSKSALIAELADVPGSSARVQPVLDIKPPTP